MGISIGRDEPADALFWVFAVASLGAVGAGCYVAAGSGSSASAWSINIVAWLFGAIAAFTISRRPLPLSPQFIAVAAGVDLALTFLEQGQDGVHRWWRAGPLHINAAAIMLPSVVVALARASARPLVTFVLAIALLVLLVLQPDAAQATAFAISTAAALLLRRERQGWWLPGVVLFLGLSAISWLRYDPLMPVPLVEDIVSLGWRIMPLGAAVGVLSLTATAVTPAAAMVLGGRPAARFSAGLALTVYFVLDLSAPVAGAFPVPLMGLGMSPVLGLWLGIGLLAAPARD